MSKILIIEDDPNMVTLLTTVLEKEGYTVVAANEGMQGTTMAHEEKPDLILLDLIMPLGGGKTALKNIKMSTHTKDIPIIVVSGTADVLLIDDVKEMGITEYISKPFDSKELLEKIKNALGE